MTIKAAIAEAYASANINDVIVDTLEFRHPTFIDQNGNLTAIRICRAYEDYEFTLELNAPLNGGQVVTFLKCGFDFTLPEISPDTTPELQISVDNVDRRMSQALEEASMSLSPIGVIYRPYLVSDPSGPQMDPPFSFTLSKVVLDIFKITGTATTNDVYNWAFPNRLYTPAEFPGLVR